MDLLSSLAGLVLVLLVVPATVIWLSERRRHSDAERLGCRRKDKIDLGGLESQRRRRPLRCVLGFHHRRASLVRRNEAGELVSECRHCRTPLTKSGRRWIPA